MRFQKSGLVPDRCSRVDEAFVLRGQRPPHATKKFVIAGTFIGCLYLLAVQYKEVETP
jgi:hypothetical protein